MRYVITGGHHNSALVVAQELIARGHTVNWIGHRHAALRDTNDSAEYIEVKTVGIPFHELRAGKSTLDIRNLIRLPLGLVHALRLISNIRPDAVISFGGYIGLTVSVAAYMRRIPIFLHEQTSIAGKANKWTAYMARRIYLTWDSSRTHYPSDKIVHVGLPLRRAFTKIHVNKLFVNNKPTILILGGKQGSHAVNKVIFAHVQDLVSTFNLIHQTGTSSETGDYERAIALQAELPIDTYQAFGYIAENDIARYMQNVDIVVGRSGAHTTYELGLLGKKAVLIPLLATHGQEQLHNARLLEKSGIAMIVPQSELSYPTLKHAIEKMMRRTTPQPLNLPRDAARRMCDDIEKYV